MREDDFEIFSQLIGTTGDLYGKHQSPFAIGLWWGVLKDFELDAIRDAISRHIRNPDTGQFMPKPADVVRMMQGSTLDAASVAWSKVDKALRSIGTYSDVVFDDALIHRVIEDMGGWVFLGTKTEKEWPFFGNEFITRYRGYASRGEVPEYRPTLTGIANAENRQRGFADFPPVLVGDERAAAQVMALGVEMKSGFKRLEVA
jgi:hypothetical protein